MANKQYLIELAVKDDKLKSSLKRSLESSDVQKTLGILGEGITEHLEKDINKATSILGKVDWASLLGKKDFEHLQQLVAKTVSANKDLIKSFIKKNDTQGIQDTIELVSKLGEELRAINPDMTVSGLARSMASFIKVIEPLSGKLNEISNGAKGFQSILNNFDSSTINRQIKETSDVVANTLKAMNSAAAKNALKTMFEDVYGAAEKLEDALMSSDAMDAYLSKFETAKSIADEMNRLMKESERSTRDIKGRLIYKQQLEGLHGKLKPMLPTIDGTAITKEVKAVSKDVDAVLEHITDKLEDSFNKTIEKKLGSIKVTVDVPTEDALIAELNNVIDKVNTKGTKSLQIIGAESAINEAQKKILDNTQEWHNRMKEALKFSKKEDIELDLGVKLREIGADVGGDLRRSIEEYFDNPSNKVAVPVELILTGENKATVTGGSSNITINGGVGGGELTAESLAKALTTPIEVKIQEEQQKDKPSGKLISLDYESSFAQEVLSVFDSLFDAIERGGENAKKISQFFTLKDIDLSALKSMPEATKSLEILNTYVSFLERGDKSILDDVENRLAKGGTKNKATLAFADLLRDSVFRFDLDNITTKEDIKRRQVRSIVENDYIPRSMVQESIYKIRDTEAKDYKLPTAEELDKLIMNLPQVWGELGKDFVPAIEALKQLRSTITDPTNESEINRFKAVANDFALNTTSLYREMSDFMHGYKIGVFNKGHNKHNKYFDYSVNGGVFSGNKLARSFDQIDYFELYDDPSGHFSRGNRQDALDNASRFDRYQLRRDARSASYRTRMPEKFSALAGNVDVKKFEPKEKPNEQLQEINKIRDAADKRVNAIEKARKASIEEEKTLEELRKQELATDKKRRTALKSQRTKNENKLKEMESSGLSEEVIALRTKNEQLNKEISELDANIAKNSIEPTKAQTVLQQLKELPNSNEVQSMIDDVNTIDAKIEEAKKQAAELDKFVNTNFKAEKNANVGYTKLEQNNIAKNESQKKRLISLGQLLNEENRTKLSSLTGLNKKDKDIVSKLLNDRKLYQLINGENGLGLPMNSLLEDVAQSRLRSYQNGLNKIDEFLLKYQGQTIKYIEDDSDLTEFMKDNNTRNVLAGTFKGSKEAESDIKAKINNFKIRMADAGKSYISDYIDMWSDKNLRELMKRDGVNTRTNTDAQGSIILDEFYRRIVDGGISKRGEAYQYLKNESAKYQNSIQKDEKSLERTIIAGWNQADVTDAKNQTAINRVKEQYKEYVNQWLYTIQDNMYNVLFGELDDKDAALKLKKNDELHGLISSMANKYMNSFGESLLTEDQLRLMNSTKLGYMDFLNSNVKSLTTEKGEKKSNIDSVIQDRTELLKQRRFDLLNKISDGVGKGKDTASLEKSLLEVEDELVKYSDQIPYLVREEFESDLLNAKNATEEEWKQFVENSTQRRNEFDTAKYTELKGRQQSVLKEIEQKSKNGESTSGLEKQLNAINKEIVQYEVNTSRLKDIEFARFPNDASIATIKLYNSEMKTLIELQQKRALLEAKGNDTVVIDRDIAKQKKTFRGRVKSRIEEDRMVSASYAPANQAAEFLEGSEKTLYILEERVKEAGQILNTANHNLAIMQSDEYKNSRIYRKRIESLKKQDAAEYVRSDEYRTRRDNGIELANKEFGVYLAEQLGEDVAKNLVYEFSENKDRADIDEMLKGAGNTTRLVENAFGASYVKEHMAYTNSSDYKKLVDEAKKNREEEIDNRLASDRAIKDAKIQEIWNNTKADIAILRQADMANSKELRDAVFAEAENAGMGDSSEYRRAIVDQVRERLIQERIESGRQEQKFYSKQYYEKARQLRAELSPAMYKQLDEHADNAVYDAVMAKIQGLVGNNANLIQGLDAKRKELIETHVGGIVDKYIDGLRMEETGMYKGVNVREMVERELANEVAFYEQKYIEASGKLRMQENERARAQSFGEIGYDEVLNPEIAQVRAETEARLSAEKEKQVALTERLTNLTAQNADQELVQSVFAELKETEKTIERLQVRAEGASEALSLRKSAREEELESKRLTPEQVKLWLIDHIESAKNVLETGTDEQKAKATNNIARWEQKLANIEKVIEESRPEVEKPKTVLDMITQAIRDGLASVTTGGTVDLDASLYNIATETTLQEILRLLGGNGAVEYANQLKAELAKDRPRYDRRNHNGGNTGARYSGGKRNKGNKDLDKLNSDGQRIFNELDAQAQTYIKSLKKGSKRYAEDFDFVKAIKEQAAVVKKQTKGSLEYIQEQTKLTVLYQDYYKKTFGAGKKKKGQPGQSAWAGQGELGKIAELKDLLLFKYQRSDALIDLNYGVDGAEAKKLTTKNKSKKKNKQTTQSDYKVDISAKDGIKNAMAEYSKLLQEEFEAVQIDALTDAKNKSEQAKAILTQLDEQLANPVASEAIENLRNKATLIDEVTETLIGLQSTSKKTNKKNKKSTKTQLTQDADVSDSSQVIAEATAGVLAAKGITNIDADDIADLGQLVNEAIAKKLAEEGLGRDTDDDILSSKGEIAQVLYDAIIEAYKMVASGNGIHTETSYSLDELGNVLDVQRGTMLGVTGAKVGSVLGHTHASDRLFGSNDFESAAKNAGLFDVLELITPLSKYRITGLGNINPNELSDMFADLAVLAETHKNASRSAYNEKIKAAITSKGLDLTEIATGLVQSNNFKTIRNASLLQTASNHELSLTPFEKVMYNFVAELKDIGYQFDEGSALGQLVQSINAIQQTKYNSSWDKEDAIEDLRPMIENVFGKNPNAQISRHDRSILLQISNILPYLGLEIDDRGAELAAQGRQLFSDNKTLLGVGKYQPDSGFGRDNSVKNEVAEGVKQGMSESSKDTASDKKLPYDVSDDSLIGKLRNTVGGDTGALAKQATLALVLSELQAISKKIPTIGKTGAKSSAQSLLEEFQKMAMGSALDKKERVSYFDLVNGAMSPALSGTAHSISQTLLNTLNSQYGANKGYRSQVHTHADSEQTWFSEKDLNNFKKNIGDFGADSIKQQVLLTKDNITVFDMTMVETAEKAAQAIDILKKAGSNIDNEVLEKLSVLGARYQSKDLGSISAKGLMDLLGVKNYNNDGKKNGAIVNPEVARKGLESYAKSDADNRNSKYVFNSFDGETLKYQLVDTEGHISKVILAWDELEKKVRVVSDTSTSSIDSTVKKIQQYRAEIKNAQNEKLLSDGDTASFIAAEQEVDKILKQIEAGDLSGKKLSEAINTLDVARAKLADEGAKIHKLISKNNKLRGGTAEVKSAVTQGVNIRSILGDEIDTYEQDGMQLFNISDNAQKYLQDYVLAYNNLVETQQKYIKDGQINNPKIQDSLKVQAAVVKKLGNEVTTAYQNTIKLQEKSNIWASQTYTDKSGAEHALGGSKYVGSQGVDRVEMLQYAKEVLGADLASVKLNTTTGKLTGVLRKNNYVVANMAVEYDNATGHLHLYQEEERESLGGIPGFINALTEKGKAIFQYIASMTSIYRVFGELRKGIQYIQDVDSALTELRKVTEETEETYDRFLNTAAKTADKVGSTIKEVINSTADWARIGYSLQDAATLAESTAILLNVSEFQSIDEATSALTSTLQAFSYTAEQSMNVVDVLNEVNFLASLYSDVYDKDGYIGKTLGTDNSEERF